MVTQTYERTTSARRPLLPAMLRSLPQTEAEQVLRAGRVNTYLAGEVLVREGEVADSFHLVLRGRAAVRVTTPSGDTAIVNILGPDSHFGEVSLLGGTPGVEPRRTASIVALEPMSTLSIPAAVFRTLRDRHPRLEKLVTALLAQRVDELSLQLVEALHDNLEQRVVSRLQALARTYGTTSGDVTIPLTQDQLGQLVGGARPSVNQILRKLCADGVVRCSRGRITIVDPERLEGCADGELIKPARVGRPPRHAPGRRATFR